MKVSFEYNHEKDIYCLLTYGKSSNNSNKSTKIYDQLIGVFGENPTVEKTSTFINDYLLMNDIDIQESLVGFQEDWGTISDDYNKRAEGIFKISLPSGITAYMTVNNRYPYSIEDNSFFVSFPGSHSSKIAMHELWHFYTWYKFGIIWEEKIGKQKYNDIKESLTVLLNTECADLFKEGMSDVGYPQHQELREKILQMWSEEKDIEKL